MTNADGAGNRLHSKHWPLEKVFLHGVSHSGREKDGSSWMWPSASSHNFLDNLQSGLHVRGLQRQLLQLEEGTSIPCRGRDRIEDDWDYGYCTKQDDCLHFQYASGDQECFLVRGIDFVNLVHLALITVRSLKKESIKLSKPIVLIAHGWSPEVGPHYSLIQNLAASARRKGFRVIVPDFRPTYAHKEGRARAERIKQIYEELIVAFAAEAAATPTKVPVILVGHSQGGAAVACACTPKLCSNFDIRGVMMLGTEDPTCHDAMNWIPPVRHVEIVHAVNDDTIDLCSIQNLAQKWACPFTKLASRTSLPKGATDINGDDVHHDFLIPDLMEGARTAFEKFLQKCLNG